VKISQLRLTLSTNPPRAHHYPPPLAPSPDFSILHPATEDEILKLILDRPNKQCGLDALPTSILMHCSCVLAPIITRIVNLSIAAGEFPPQLKQSIITPLLKKTSLDKENLSNYRPISNLSTISKIVESRLTDNLVPKLYSFPFLTTLSMPLVVNKSPASVCLISRLPLTP